MGATKERLTQQEFERKLKQIDIALAKMPPEVADTVTQQFQELTMELRYMYTAVVEEQIEFDREIAQGLRDIENGNVLGTFDTAEDTMRALRSKTPK